MNNRVPPHDNELERAVICCLLTEPTLPIVQQLSPEDFYCRAHQCIFGAIRCLYDMHFDPDILMIKAELRKTEKLDEAGGETYIDSLLGIVPSTANADYYADGVKDYSIRRSLLKISASIANSAFDQTSDLQEVLKDAIGELTALGAV